MCYNYIGTAGPVCLSNKVHQVKELNGKIAAIFLTCDSEAEGLKGIQMMFTPGRIKIPAVLKNLRAITDCVSAAASSAGFSAHRIGAIQLALEEAVTNVFKYAGSENPGEIEVLCAFAEGKFSIEIRDPGREFDITKLPDPDLSLDISERPIGKLGAYFIKKSVDDISYRRLPGFNVLTLVFELEIKRQ